jgi:aspartate dehydrogenase
MTAKMKIVLGGFGNVGQQLARTIQNDPDCNIEIAAVSARNLDAARERLATYDLNVPVVSAAETPEYARVIVECATYDGFRDVVEPAVMAGCHVVAVSVGALAVNLDLIDLAKQHGATIQIAGGTLPGLDTLRAAREGDVEFVRLESQILPKSLVHESYITDNGIDLDRAETEPVFIFSGTAREAASHFPRHFNVAVSLSLAGIGLDRTQVEIHANGTLPGARHTIKVKSDVVDLEMTSHNYPSQKNSRTSRIVAPSIMAALRELNTHIRIGS